MKNPTEPNLKTEWFPLLTLAMSLLAAFYFHPDFAYLWPAVLALVYAMFLLFPYFKINHQESAQLKEQWHKGKELSLSFLFTLQIVGSLILSGQNKILLWALPILFLLFLASLVPTWRKVIKHRQIYPIKYGK